jgi:hypothetical protein
MGKFAVILDEPDVRDVASLAGLLAPAYGLPLQDAAQRIRYSRGILLEASGEESAREILAALEKKGRRAFLVDRSLTGPFPRIVRSIRAEMDGEALVAAVGHDLNVKEIPWSRFDAFYVWALEEEVPGFKPKRETYLYVLREKTYSKEAQKLLEQITYHQEKHRNTVVSLGADLYSSSLGTIYRFTQKGFNYAYLGERLCPHSMDNFLLLLRDIRRFAAGAFVPGETLSFLETCELQGLLLWKAEELRRYTRWIHLRTHARKTTVDSGEAAVDAAAARTGEPPGTEGGAAGEGSPGKPPGTEGSAADLEREKERDSVEEERDSS